MTQTTHDDDLQRWQQLKQLMQSHFSLDELHALCFDLGVDYDLLGEKLGLAERIIRLIEYMMRNDRIADLLAGLRENRPTVSWPDVNPDAPLPAGWQSPSGQGATNYQFGDIKAAQVNVGGSQVFHGAISIDMRETGSSSKASETGKGQVGPAKEADLAARLTLVAETLLNSPNFNDSESESFRNLVQEMSQQLSQLTAAPLADKEKLVTRIEALSRELTAESLDPDMVEIMGESLRRAAQRMTGVSPAILALVDQLIALALTAGT